MSRQNLSRSIFQKILAVVVLTWMMGGTAFGWAGNIHAKLCQRTFDDPVVAPLLSGINQSAIENYISEPTDACHEVQWLAMPNRSYIDTGVPFTAFDWNALDETTRLKYLQHVTTDVCVPAHHPPANTVYNSDMGEFQAETQTSGWTNMPIVAGTTSYTHTQSGHSYNFTGTTDQVVNTFYDACVDNADWYKDTAGWFDLHTTEEVSTACWNGMTLGLMLQRAVFVDYFLAKQNAFANCENSYVSGSIAFTAVGSYDTDNISWNANGTYSNTGGGIIHYAWDYNSDGNWDRFSSDPNVSVPVSTLVGMGCNLGAWNYYQFSVLDDEGKWSETRGSFYLPSGAVPEPATMSLLGLGGLALLRRRKA